jgi:hypothetical protein
MRVDVVAPAAHVGDAVGDFGDDIHGASGVLGRSSYRNGASGNRACLRNGGLSPECAARRATIAPTHWNFR